MVLDTHVISMVVGRAAHFDYYEASGERVACLGRRGAITLTPAGPTASIRLHTPTDLVHCALEEAFTREVAETMDPRPGALPQFQMCVKHGPMQSLLGLLLDELRTENPSGRLYADSLVHVLAMQYLAAGLTGRSVCNSRTSALPQRILRRVQERIEADLEADLSLETLAEESGYSRAHFLRMFQAATGVTPHQYVLDLRLRRAQEYLRQKNASIIDVALSCGFSSQSHMTSVFRQRLNTTPGDYRRNV
ncbi:MAG TPA: AraC family transcriptional regulator [Bryobacteraceae bacterium]|nr:AraC family transcriptional regulator [Bryobacteraceae bacterium]